MAPHGRLYRITRNRPMREFVATVRISAPPERVWAIMADVERWHEWTASIRSVRRLDSGPFGLGSRVLIRQPNLPPAWWVVTRWEPNRGFAWTSKSPGATFVADHAITPDGDGCVVALTVRASGPFGVLFAKLNARITRRYMTMEGDGLKSKAEAPPDRDATSEEPRR